MESLISDEPNGRESLGRRRLDHLTVLLIATNLVLILIIAVGSVVLLHGQGRVRSNSRRLVAVEHRQRVVDLRLNRASARRELARAARKVAYRSCRRQVRMTKAMNHGWDKFAELIVQSDKSVEQFVRDGTLTEVQAQRAIAQARDNARMVLSLKIKPFNCIKVRDSIPVR